MNLEAIKQLKEQVDTLKEEVKSAKSVTDTVKTIEQKLAELEGQRKKTFDIKEFGNDIKKDLSKKAANLALKAKLLGRDVSELDEYKSVVPMIEKAITPTDIAGWIAEQFSKEVIDLMEYDLRIEKLFGSVVVPEGVGSLSFPQKTARSKAYLIAPAQDAIESVIQGGKVTFKPVKLKTLVEVSDEAKNEAVVNALLNVVKEDIAYSLAIGVEDALVNGDPTGDINDNPPATDVKNAFNGLRKFGLDNSVDNGGGAITIGSIRTAVKQMGVFGVNPSECVLIVNPRVYAQLKNLPDLQTIDKIGNSAVLKTGTVGMIDGMQVIVTDFIPNNLDATGKVDNTTPGTKTAALVVNTKAFRVGKRNVVEFEQDRSIINDTNIYTGRVYRDFQKMYASVQPIAEIVNIGD